MTIVFYSTFNNEYQVKVLLESIKYSGLDCNILYFTIGFNSEITFPKLTTVGHPYLDLPNLILYKPTICKRALEYDDKIIYVDTDIIFSKSFTLEKLKVYFEYITNYPLGSRGPVAYPFTYYAGEGWEYIYSEIKLRDYYNIPDRTTDYIYGCFLLFNKECLDFIKEWESIVNNKYFLESHLEYFPFQDETALNVLLWKHKYNMNLGFLFLNTDDFDTFKEYEEKEKTLDEYNNFTDYYVYDNVNTILLFHGIKNKNESQKYIKYFNENSPGYPRSFTYPT